VTRNRPCSRGGLRASLSAIFSYEHASNLSHDNSADSSPADWVQKSDHNGHIESLCSWLSSHRRRTINLPVHGHRKKKGRKGTKSREVKEFCVRKMREKKVAHFLATKVWVNFLPPVMAHFFAAANRWGARFVLAFLTIEIHCTMHNTRSKITLEGDLN